MRLSMEKGTMVEHLQELPLFPLKTVLFPGGSIPLNVFEDRYKQMINECLNKDARFGIVLIKDGPEVGGPAITYDMGTIATARDIKHLPDGRILMNAFGEYRFKIIQTIQTSPFIKALVEIDSENNQENIPDSDIEKFCNAATTHIKNLLGLKGGWVQEAVIPKNPLKLSYFLSEIADLTTLQKQDLLAQSSCHQRLVACEKAINKERQNLVYKTKLQLLKNFSKN